MMRFLRVVPRGLTVARVPRVLPPRRFASSGPGDDKLTAEDADRVQQITNQIRQHPEIREKLDAFQDLLKAKGFNSNEPPSLFKLMGLLAQKDVKDAISSLKASLEKNGVKLGPEDLNAFMKIYGFDKQ